MNMESGVTKTQRDEILDIVLAFHIELRYEKLLEMLLTKMMDLTNSDAGTLYLLRNNKLHYVIVKNHTLGIHQSMSDKDKPAAIELDASNIETFTAYAAIENEIVVVDDVYADTRFNFVGPLKYDQMTGYRTKSMLLLPLSTFSDHVDNDPELLGAIQLINAKDKDTGELTTYSTMVDRSILLALSNITASILLNALYTHESNQLLRSLVDITTQAIAERSAYSKNHTQNVANYCKNFALFLHEKFKKRDKYHFTESEIEAITLAALLHDIGKIITPLEVMDKADRLGNRANDIRYRIVIKELQLENQYYRNQISKEEWENETTYIKQALDDIEKINLKSQLSEGDIDKINKYSSLTYTSNCGNTVPILSKEDIDALSILKGTLTEKERTIMQDHVMVTDRLLDKITFPKRLKKAREWAVNHHEFLNGTGYPNKLSADEIDIGSRIITIADIFDALISNDRPYKKSIPIKNALEIIFEMADEGKLDKELVSLFVESKVWEISYQKQ